MRSLPYAVFVATASLLIAKPAGADDFPTRSQSVPPPMRAMEPADSIPAPGQPKSDSSDSLTVLRKKAADLQIQLVGVRADSPQDDDLKKQIELLRKQMETQQKMIDLLAEQLKKQPPAGPTVEKLQTQAATLEARSKQAAQRDADLSQAVDNINEHLDADERNGPRLPAQLKELFFPSQTNESPLSIYGTMAVGYSRINPGPGGFYFGEFSPDFFLKLNDWIMFQGEIGIGAGGSVNPTFLQADFFVNDWLTIVAGRFVAPIGFYNERLNNPWINKLPGDAPGGTPLLWMQVLPPVSLVGVQAKGAFYLGASPIKLEYAAYVSNGLNVTPNTPGAPTIDELANLENMGNTFNSITDEKIYGGRIGLWWPEVGLAGGISGLHNGAYVAGGSEDSINLWALDLNFHKGNWDLRAEYGMVYQQAADFIGTNIRRQGFYVQAAYRQRDAASKILQNLELVYRYSYVDFQGIDPTTLDLGSYATPVDVPVTRQQNAFGINYYFSPRLLLQVAYQINDEPGFHLHDNNFMTQLAWGW